MRMLILLLLAVSFGSGCVSSRVTENSRVPEIAIDDAGIITVGGRQAQLGKLASAARDAGYRKNQEINILIPDVPDRKLMKEVSGELAHAGYSRIIFEKKRKALSALADKSDLSQKPNGR